MSFKAFAKISEFTVFCFISDFGVCVSSKIKVDKAAKRRYLCRFCEKMFPSAYKQQRHERIHTGERPYKCEVCEKCFNTKESWRSHQITHMKTPFVYN